MDRKGFESPMICEDKIKQISLNGKADNENEKALS